MAEALRHGDSLKSHTGSGDPGGQDWDPRQPSRLGPGIRRTVVSQQLGRQTTRSPSTWHTQDLPEGHLPSPKVLHFIMEIFKQRENQ